jgi:hypothetical protein
VALATVFTFFDIDGEDLNLQRREREVRGSGGASNSERVKLPEERQRRPADRAAIRVSPSPATKKKSLEPSNTKGFSDFTIFLIRLF